MRDKVLLIFSIMVLLLVSGCIKTYEESTSYEENTNLKDSETLDTVDKLELCKPTYYLNETSVRFQINSYNTDLLAINEELRRQYQSSYYFTNSNTYIIQLRNYCVENLTQEQINYLSGYAKTIGGQFRIYNLEYSPESKDDIYSFRIESYFGLGNINDGWINWNYTCILSSKPVKKEGIITLGSEYEVVEYERCWE